MGRRRFLALGAAGSSLPFLSRLSALAAAVPVAAPLPPDRRLSLYNIHTGESTAAEYCRAGGLIPDGLAKIDHILRDHRNGETVSINVRLLDLLHTLARAVGAAEPYHVISGYRSPKTNDYLRTRGEGVAVNSLHLVGKAVDVRVPGIALRDLYRTAVKLAWGGVGIYPASDFVHLDIGRVRTW